MYSSFDNMYKKVSSSYSDFLNENSKFSGVLRVTELKGICFHTNKIAEIYRLLIENYDEISEASFII
jgi:hypothetical protein